MQISLILPTPYFELNQNSFFTILVKFLIYGNICQEQKTCQFFLYLFYGKKIWEEK
jgi:hypothetical protein